MYKNKRNRLKIELGCILQEKVIGAQIRSRAKYIEEGEKSTSYFLNLEKKRQTNNRIIKLKHNNKEATNNEDILKCTADFYTSLYKSNSPKTEDIQTYLNNIDLEKKLSEENKKKCEGNITYDECTHIVYHKLKLNKSPGYDGLPSEFYKTFWSDIGRFLCSVFLEIYEKEGLSNSQYLSIITLIHKGNERELLKNYRPISLANTDYKILAFVLAHRLQKVLNDIINLDQNGYIKQRFIGNNIRLVDDIINYAVSHKIGGALMFLDFQKVFDSLEWDFLISVSAKFNFGENFIKWVKLIYKSPRALIKNNGWLSEQIKQGRGIKQGCPLSALLFLLAVEILGILIRKENNLKGFKMNINGREKEVKISQFADDSVLCLLNIYQVMPAIDLINQFGNVAGLKQNKDYSPWYMQINI